MAGRGPQSFQKKLKEQQRKEKQQEKIAKRLERKRQAVASPDALTEPGDAESSLSPANDLLEKQDELPSIPNR